ncbi:VOC family protein [Mucilaginibacter sp. OK098]|uniref:VOC family protein n=1 Tax=Mucilaginibacter sp. OK098 TaxID=1855297 RepID=UPI0009137F90|nr:VOC family protein [Mucilaginibacter sp. OK098]SHN34545.1 Catechol 2,3-dioxygenase [Mucilaginibacter sp. OK098]
MIEFIRADHINICVPPERLEEALRFYADVIGLQQIERPDHLFSTPGYWFDIGDIELHIGVEPQMPRSVRHIAFEIKNVDIALKLFEKHNVELMEEPVIPGRKRLAFIDPFGNRMELLQMVDL